MGEFVKEGQVSNMANNNSRKTWEKPVLTDLSVEETMINTPGTKNDSTTTSGSAS